MYVSRIACQTRPTLIWLNENIMWVKRRPRCAYIKRRTLWRTRAENLARCCQEKRSWTAKLARNEKWPSHKYIIYICALGQDLCVLDKHYLVFLGLIDKCAASDWLYMCVICDVVLSSIKIYTVWKRRFLGLTVRTWESTWTYNRQMMEAIRTAWVMLVYF